MACCAVVHARPWPRAGSTKPSQPHLHQAFGAAQQKQRLQPLRCARPRPFAGTCHQQGGGPGVRFHAGARQHGDRGNRIVHRRGAARVHGVRQARLAHLQIAPVVARGGHSQVLQLDHPRTARRPCIGRFERHGPGRTAGLAAQGAQFPIKRRQRMPHPCRCSTATMRSTA